MSKTLQANDTESFEEIAIADAVVDNPFRDPAVLEALKNTNKQTVQSTISLDNVPEIKQSFISIEESSQSIDINNSYTSIELNAPESSKCVNTSDLLKKQEELKKIEEALNKKEEELFYSRFSLRRKNWPPLPKFCCVQPCFYQDINVDIPPEFQKIVSKLYQMWIFHEIVLVANICAGICILDFNIIGLGILYILLFTPFSYVCWFRSAYKAFSKDSSVNFVFFFFMFAFQFIISVFQALGNPRSGTIGIVTLFKSFLYPCGVFSMILIFIVASGFCLCVVGDFILLSKIYKLYKSTGGSFEKAQNEFTTSFLSSPTAENVASEVLRTIGRNQNQYGSGRPQ